MSAVVPVPVDKYRFKKFGCVQFSDEAFTEQAEHLSAVAKADQLLAVSNRHGVLFIARSTEAGIQDLYIAETAAVLTSVADDKREQVIEAAEKEEHLGTPVDAAADESVFTTHHTGLEGIWHISLNCTEDYLLLSDTRRAEIYTITPGEPATLALFTDINWVDEAIIAVQWSPIDNAAFFTLSSDGVMRGFSLVDAQDVQPTITYQADTTQFTAFCISNSQPAHKIYLGDRKGVLYLADITENGIVMPDNGYRPPDDSNDQLEELHFIQQLSASTLVLGYRHLRDTPDHDPISVSIRCFDLSSLSFSFYGDVLNEAEETHTLAADPEQKKFETRHRYHLLALYEWKCGLLYSNRSTNVSVLGTSQGHIHHDVDAPHVIIWDTGDNGDPIRVPNDENYDETYALGMGWDLTNHMSTADTERKEGAAAATAGTQSEEDVPFPMLFMLTSDARLHMFSFISSYPSMGKASAMIMHHKQTAQLPQIRSATSKTLNSTGPTLEKAPDHEQKQMDEPVQAQTPAVYPVNSLSSATVNTAPALSSSSMWNSATTPFSAPSFSFGSSSASTASQASFAPPAASAFSFTSSATSSSNDSEFTMPSFGGIGASTAATSTAASLAMLFGNSTTSTSPVFNFPATVTEQAKPKATLNNNLTGASTSNAAVSLSSSSSLLPQSKQSTTSKPPVSAPTSLPAGIPSTLKPVSVSERAATTPAVTQSSTSAPRPQLVHSATQTDPYASHHFAIDYSTNNTPTLSLPSVLARPTTTATTASSGLQPDDFRSNSAHMIEQNFLSALQNLATEINRIHKNGDQMKQQLKALYAPPSSTVATTIANIPDRLTAARMYRLCSKTNVLSSTLSELGSALDTMQDKDLSALLHSLEDTCRQVEFAFSQFEYHEHPVYQHSIQEQPLEPHAHKLLQDYKQRSLPLERALEQMNGYVEEQWKQIRINGNKLSSGQQSSQTMYNNTLNATQVKQVVESHTQIIAAQVAEIKRLKEMLRAIQEGNQQQGRSLLLMPPELQQHPRLLTIDTPLRDQLGQRKYIEEAEEKKQQQQQLTTTTATPLTVNPAGARLRATQAPIIPPLETLPKTPGTTTTTSTTPATAMYTPSRSVSSSPLSRFSSISSPASSSPAAIDSQLMHKLSASFSDKLAMSSKRQQQRIVQKTPASQQQPLSPSEQKRLQKEQARQKLQELIQATEDAEFKPTAFQTPPPSLPPTTTSSWATPRPPVQQESLYESDDSTTRQLQQLQHQLQLRPQQQQQERGSLKQSTTPSSALSNQSQSLRRARLPVEAAQQRKLQLEEKGDENVAFASLQPPALPAIPSFSPPAPTRPAAVPPTTTQKGEAALSTSRSSSAAPTLKPATAPPAPGPTALTEEKKEKERAVSASAAISSASPSITLPPASSFTTPTATKKGISAPTTPVAPLTSPPSKGETSTAEAPTASSLSSASVSATTSSTAPSVFSFSGYIPSFGSTAASTTPSSFSSTAALSTGTAASTSAPAIVSSSSGAVSSPTASASTTSSSTTTVVKPATTAAATTPSSSSSTASSTSFPAFSFSTSSAVPTFGFGSRIEKKETQSTSNKEEGGGFQLDGLDDALNRVDSNVMTTTPSNASTNPFSGLASTAPAFGGGLATFGKLSFGDTSTGSTTSNSFAAVAAIPFGSSAGPAFGQTPDNLFTSNATFGTPASGSSLQSFQNVFGQSSTPAPTTVVTSPPGGAAFPVFGSSASNPFASKESSTTSSISNNPFGSPPSHTTTSNPFNLPTGAGFGPGFGTGFGSSTPSSVFGSGGFGQSFSSAAFGGGGIVGSSNSNVFGSAFGSPASQPMFGSSTFGGGAFGASAMNTNTGGTSSVFGTPSIPTFGSSNSSFGQLGQQQPQQQQSAFGTTLSGGGFRGFAAAAQSIAGGGGGWGSNASFPAAPSFGFSTTDFRG